MIRPTILSLVVLIAPLPAVAAQANDAKQAAGKINRDPNAVRCIKTPVIGSLAQFQRTCMTNREWDRTRAELQRMRDPSSCPNGQCSGS